MQITDPLSPVCKMQFRHRIFLGQTLPFDISLGINNSLRDLQLPEAEEKQE